MAVKVAQVLAGRAQGGAELFYDRLVPALHGRVPQVAIVRPSGARAEALEAAGVPTHRFRFGHHRLDWRTRRGVARALVREGADLAITWMSRASQLTRPGACPIAARLGGFYPLRNFRHCDRFIANTQGLAAHLEAGGVPSARIHVIGNFIDESPAAPTPRTAFATPPDAPLALACGRLHWNKGYDVLLRALADVPGVFLWIAGDGPLRRALERLSAELGVDGRVRFLGWQASVNPHLAAADLFVCASRHEPLGNVILEAWAHRCPILASATHGPAELLEHGVTGWLCRNEDARDMARGMKAMLADGARAAALAAAGAERHRERFAKARILDQYEEFIHIAAKRA